MIIEINLLGEELLSGPLLMMLMLLAMIAADKHRGRRQRSATHGKDQDRVD